MDTSWMLQRRREEKEERRWFLSQQLWHFRNAATLLFLILFLAGGALLFYNVPHLPNYLQTNKMWWMILLALMCIFGGAAFTLTLMNMAAKKRLKAATQ